MPATKKESAAAVGKAKKGDSSKASKRAGEEEKSAESSKKTKISVTVDGITITIDRSDLSKAKASKATTAKSTPAKAPKSTPAKASKSTPKTAAAKKPAPSIQKTPKPAARKKKAATEPPTNAKDHPGNFPQRSGSDQVPDGTRKPRTKQTARKSACSGPAELRDQSSYWYRPPIKDEPKDEPDDDNDDDMDTRPDITQDQLSVSGVYDVRCSQLADQSPEDADKLRMFICVDNKNGMIWGGFQLAWKSGVIKIDDVAANQELSFGWRARDDSKSNGNLRFGKGCDGEITFWRTPSQHTQIYGTFHNLFPETIDFEGIRQQGPLWCGKSAYKFKQEWDDYPREAYAK